MSPKELIPKPIRRCIKTVMARTEMSLSLIQSALFKVNIPDAKQIPIVINNFNRLGYLKRLIASLESRGYKNIHIIDNNSTYPPLLEYYEKCPYNVFRLKENIGYKAIWKTGIYDIFKRSYYVYTDVDMEIDECCPDDFMQHFVDIIESQPFCQKVGFGIKIDDLPDHYANKNKVVEWESQFWKEEVAEGVYRAQIDTTFALYRPFCGGVASAYHKTYRTGYPYIIKHLPWYIDSNNYDEEELYYINSVKRSTHWSVLSKK